MFLCSRNDATDKPILTITGSDPTGGSGIQADIKTITALGGYAVSAITSVTVQTTLGIQQFHDLPAQVVAGQMEAVMNDVQPETVKVGLMRTVETVKAVVDALVKYRPSNIVYAPLSQSSQGEPLIPDDVEQAINRLLLPVCTLILTDRFKSHGDMNLYASAVAYYLNEGDNASDAQRKARQFLNVQTAHSERLRSRGFELFDEFRQMVETHFREKKGRIKQGLLDAGIKDKFDEKTVELLMGNAETLRNITDYTQKEPVETVTVEEPEEQEVTVSRSKGRGI